MNTVSRLLEMKSDLLKWGLPAVAFDILLEEEIKIERRNIRESGQVDYPAFTAHSGSGSRETVVRTEKAA